MTGRSGSSVAPKRSSAVVSGSSGLTAGRSSMRVITSSTGVTDQRSCSTLRRSPIVTRATLRALATTSSRYNEIYLPELQSDRVYRFDVRDARDGASNESREGKPYNADGHTRGRSRDRHEELSLGRGRFLCKVRDPTEKEEGYRRHRHLEAPSDERMRELVREYAPEEEKRRDRRDDEALLLGPLG